MHIYMSPIGNLLVQEAHLTKNSILSSFDMLLKANFYQDNDGYFYSAFFHLTIGLERLMKLAIVSDCMLNDDYVIQDKKILKNYSHRICDLYETSIKLATHHLNEKIYMPNADSSDMELLLFLHNYAESFRYFNLDEICNSTQKEQKENPLAVWMSICKRIYEENTSPIRREKTIKQLIDNLNVDSVNNLYTSRLDFHGNPMTVIDVRWIQLLIQKSSSMIIWKVIELFRPLYFLFDKISQKASDYEVNNKKSLMVLPHFEEFFHFFLSDRATTMRKKRWLSRY